MIRACCIGFSPFLGLMTDLMDEYELKLRQARREAKKINSTTLKIPISRPTFGTSLMDLLRVESPSSVLRRFFSAFAQSALFTYGQTCQSHLRSV